MEQPAFPTLRSLMTSAWMHRQTAGGLVVELTGTAGSGKTTLGILVCAAAAPAGKLNLAGLSSPGTYARAVRMGYGNTERGPGAALWWTTTNPEVAAGSDPVGTVFWDTGTNEHVVGGIQVATDRTADLVQDARDNDRLLIITNPLHFPTDTGLVPAVRRLADVVLFVKSVHVSAEGDRLCGAVVFHVLRHPTMERALGQMVDLRTMEIRQWVPKIAFVER